METSEFVIKSVEKHEQEKTMQGYNSEHSKYLEKVLAGVSMLMVDMANFPGYFDWLNAQPGGKEFRNKMADAIEEAVL